MGQIKFVWTMTEENYSNMLNDLNNATSLKSQDYDVYGNCMTGNLCADIQLFEDENQMYSWVNIFQLHKNTGYGYTSNETPYDLLDVAFSIEGILGLPFESFKSKFEENFVDFIERSDLLLETENYVSNGWSLEKK